jgi:hypothetical protein
MNKIIQLKQILRDVLDQNNLHSNKLLFHDEIDIMYIYITSVIIVNQAIICCFLLYILYLFRYLLDVIGC